MSVSRWRSATVFLLLFALYQSAEGIGGHVLHSVPVQAALMVACVAVAWPLSRWLGYRGYEAYGLHQRHHWLGWLGGTLALAVLAKAFALAVGLRLEVYSLDGPIDAAGLRHTLVTLPMLALFTFVPSLAEDLVTRGFWYRAAAIRWRSGGVFVAATSAIYLANHLYRLERGPVEWLMLLCYGMAYATALWRSGNLWAAVGLHWGWNLANELFDALAPMSVVHAAAGSLLSAAAHVVMTALLFAVPARRQLPR